LGKPNNSGRNTVGIPEYRKRGQDSGGFHLFCRIWARIIASPSFPPKIYRARCGRPLEICVIKAFDSKAIKGLTVFLSAKGVC